MHASIPAWVPVLFLGLMVLGYRQSMTRTVRPAALLGLALGMFGLSLYGVIAAFGPAVPALVLWAAGYAAAGYVGMRLLASSPMAAVGPLVRIPGSWVPMMLLLGIFTAKFVLGFAAGVHAGFLHDLWFVAAMSGLLGALSGGFGARALAVQRVARAA